MSLFSGRNERLALMYGIGNAQEAERRAEALRLQGQTSALGAIDAGEPLSLDAINSGEQLSLASLGRGYDAARGQYGEARDLYQPYADAGQSGLGMLQNSLGLNGAAGNDAAVGAFKTSPGYDFRVDQATDGYARKASAMGALGSGNTAAGIATLAGNLADQEYGGWQDRLKGLGQMGLQATGAQATLTKGIGDLYGAQGGAESSLYGGNAKTRADIYGGNAKARAGVHSGMAGMGMQNIQGTANTIGQLTGNYMQRADDASRNSWSLGLGLLSGLGNMATLGTGGGGTMGSSMLSGLRGLGSGGGGSQFVDPYGTSWA